jgi:hypothetical protein
MTETVPLTRNTPNTDPLGNTWRIKPSKFYPGLLEIVTDKPNVKNPPPISGHFTSFDKANGALQSHLDKVWAASDEKAKRNTKQDATATSR